MKSTRKIPLQLALIVPFVIQILVIVGFLGLISYRSVHRAVKHVAGRLHDEISLRVEDRLFSFLNTPHQLNRISADLIGTGVVDAENANELQQYFLRLVRAVDNVTSAYFGNPRGGIAGAGREGAEGKFYVYDTEGFKAGRFRKYSVDGEGNRTGLLDELPFLDSGERPWYSGAVLYADAVWSNPIILSTGQDIAIAASRPVFNKQRRLIGVVSIDIFLSHLGAFMEDLQIGNAGIGFIIQRSGLMIASSTGEKMFTDPDSSGIRRRISVTESSSPTVRLAADFAARQTDFFHDLTGVRQFEIETSEGRYLLRANPIRETSSIDWIVFVMVPEVEYMGRILADIRVIAIFFTAGLTLVICVGFFIARGLAAPIVLLDSHTRALTEGAWNGVNLKSPIREINRLNLSFNRMVNNLNNTLESLADEIDARKRAEETLKSLLSEKDTLMKELQHRVKNNLNVIDGLLSLESEKLKDENSRKVFLEAQTRIHSMSGMYERLYRSGSGDLIDLKIYIRDFVEFLFGIYVIDREKIRFVTTLEDIRLDLKRAVPVGLLLNELISNSLKYAFPENRTGEVRVDLKNLEGTVVLSVSDDGVGLPENFNPGETDSMGLTLVNMLAKQIGGAVEIKKAEERGTTAVLRFNL